MDRPLFAQAIMVLLLTGTALVLSLVGISVSRFRAWLVIVAVCDTLVALVIWGLDAGSLLHL
jgi:hypothetical protein